MPSGLNGLVYTNVPVMPNVQLPLTGTSFPTAAPSNQRSAAIAVSDMESCVSLTHNSTSNSQGFVLYAWSDVCAWWIPYQASGTVPRYGTCCWLVFTGTPIYIVATVALSTGATVFLGGVTLQGITPVPFSGD